MKRTIVAGSVLMVLAVTGVSAQNMMTGPGSWDPGSWGPGGCAPGMWAGQGYGYDGTAAPAETVKRSGRLSLKAGELPTLMVGNTEYTLRIHPAISDDMELRTGQTVTVEGDLIERKSPDLMTTYRVIRVTALESGGTRVIAPDTGYGYSHHHRRGGYSTPMDRPQRGFENGRNRR